MFNNSDWGAMYGNLRKAQRWWCMATKVMTNTVATVQTWVMIYKAVVQMVLLYGSKSWVVTEVMLKVMEGFHHWVAQRISGMSYRRVREGGWEW